MKPTRIRQLRHAGIPADAVTSEEMAKATGASLRQLQRWDELLHVVPRYGQMYHARLYSPDQVAIVKKLVDLRKAGVPLRQAIKCMLWDWRSIMVVAQPTIICGVLVVPPRDVYTPPKATPIKRQTPTLSDSEMDAIALRDRTIANGRRGATL